MKKRKGEAKEERRGESNNGEDDDHRNFQNIILIIFLYFYFNIKRTPGFIPIWARFAPTTCLPLVIFEQIKPFFGVEGSGE